MDGGIPVLHADRHLLVVDKPAELLSVPGRGADRQDCLIARLRTAWPQALVVHRLDMSTSGLMVFARDPATQATLGLAFAERRVDKRYRAVVAGTPAPDAVPADADADAPSWSRIDLPLIADWPRRPLQKVDHAGGRPSLTRWRMLEPLPRPDGPADARIELRPLTGRTHQLRVHLQAIGHPILGDRLYADPAVAARAPRLLLHACGLDFDHPATGARLHFEAEAPF